MNAFRSFFALSTIVLGVAAAPAAFATELDAEIDSLKGGYQRSTVTIKDNTVEGDSAIVNQQAEVALYARSGARDQIELDISSRSLSWSEQNVAISNNTVRDGSAIVNQQGSVAITMH